ncbi:MAG: hypothetical protein WC562_07780 [Dehalococcoidia bacterium]
MLIYLLSCILATLVVVFLLHKIGISERYIIFAGFAVFGLFAGTFSGLVEHREGLMISNFIGVCLGDEVSSYAINHLGDPYSPQAHYTIPWVFRVPQVYLFASLVSYSIIGLIIQAAYNIFKKPAAFTRHRVAIITVIAFIVCIGIATGAVYATQSEYERNRTVSPCAYPDVEIGSGSPAESAWNMPDECVAKDLS